MLLAFYKNLISIFILLQAAGTAYGQDATFRYITINDLQNEVIDMEDYVLIFDDTFSLNYSFNSIQAQRFLPCRGFKVSRYHTDITTITQWLKFGIENTGKDTLTAYFYCGKHNLVSIKTDHTPDIKDGGFACIPAQGQRMFPDYFLPLQLAPQAKTICYVKIKNYGIVIDQITPFLYIGEAIKPVRVESQGTWMGWLLFTCITMGGILILGLFILSQFFSNQQKDYLYYGLYVLMVFFSTERAFEWNHGVRIISQYFPYYFVKAAVFFNALSGIFYLLFLSNFLDLKQNMPRTYKLIQWMIAILMTGISTLCVLYVSHFPRYPVLIITTLVSIFPITSSLVIVILIAINMKSNTLAKFMVWGFAFLFVGAGITIFVNNFARQLMSDNFPLSTLMEIGVLLEIICFALGLGYKSRLVEKQKTAYELANLQLVFDHQLQIEKVRSSLSRDLHDDIGSTLSSINILSRMAKKNAPENSDSSTTDALEKINERSQRLLNNMSDIVWSIKPENDSMEEMLSRMRQYATDMLESKNIDYTIDFPKEKSDYIFSLEVKNNLYLIFKEAVNNLCKYAQCQHAHLSLSIDQKIMTVLIRDDGIGFSTETPTNTPGGNGLKNMRQRAAEIKAELVIESAPEKGTTITLLYRLL